jgi:hypothetical protein
MSWIETSEWQVLRVCIVLGYILGSVNMKKYSLWEVIEQKEEKR